jgi:UDP-glucose 4-epimerase
MKKTILVTGASGFIGKHLLRKLTSMEINIIATDLKFDVDFRKEFGTKMLKLEGDLLDKDFISSSLINHSPDYVFHLAASKSRNNTIEEFKTSHEINYFGTLNLLDSLRKCKNLELVALMGTIEEYGKTTSPFTEFSHEMPDSAYGLSKLSATKLALIFNHQFNLPTVIFRPSITFGPGQGLEMFIPALIKTLLKKLPFKMTKGEQLRDFIFIDDLIEGLISCISSKNLEGQIINIASGTSIKLKEMAINISNMINANEYLKIGELPYRKSEIMNYSVEVTKAASLLNWESKTSVNAGLEKTILFYKKELLNEA